MTHHRPNPSGAGANAPSLTESVIKTAIAWRIRLESGLARPSDEQACRHWRDADPAHELAWQRLGKLDSVFHDAAGKAPALARTTLHRTDEERRRLSRRQALCVITGSALGLSSLGWLATDQGVLQHLDADYATRTGERHQYILQDRSRVWLNTDSAIKVRFNDGERHVHLSRGEIHLHTDTDARPLQVHFPQGSLTTLGTRFLVRREQDHTLLQVIEGDVMVRPRLTGAPAQVKSGQVFRVSDTGLTAVDGRRFDYSAWVEGIFSVRNMPLAELLAELSRYRTGILRCDPSLQTFLASGVYQLNDTGLALEAMARSANAEVRYFTRWWAEIVPVQNA
ncbi:FecR domain-containing protein [Alcanivorax sp. 24]|uniref:FecR domain-containing protein n=1 Tax=Alcanivorax sp. 24 TaxID=2545266 RepID=UPI0014150250|nr:FecR domain-containing protein [Alcanivorax sp. 24]